MYDHIGIKEIKAIDPVWNMYVNPLQSSSNSLLSQCLIGKAYHSFLKRDSIFRRS